MYVGSMCGTKKKTILYTQFNYIEWMTFDNLEENSQTINLIIMNSSHKKKQN